jgi:hypothetical protein
MRWGRDARSQKEVCYFVMISEHGANCNVWDGMVFSRARYIGIKVSSCTLTHSTVWAESGIMVFGSGN